MCRERHSPPVIGARAWSAPCTAEERIVQKFLRRIDIVLISVRKTWVAMAALAITSVVGAPSVATAQGSVGPDPGKISLVGGFDFTNAYMFRGLRQDDTRVIMFPFVEASVDLHDGQGSIEDVALLVGSWNSLHTGAAGLRGSSGKLWYESRFYSGAAFTVSPGLTVAGTYTAYPSPNNSFSTVKEVGIRVSADDRITPGGFVLRPHALVAFEMDTDPGIGQADGGGEAGTYLEVGVAPGISDLGFALTIPIKLGMSLDDYYELGGEDHPFGFLSLGAIASVPIGRTTSYGSWNVHGGLEFQSLGDTPEAFNGGDQSKLIGFVGVGFTY
jgi:hypothetical protein